LNRDDQVAAVKKLERKHNFNIFSSLNTETNKTSFLSAISEIRFGQFFDNCRSTLTYEPLIDGLTPDWLVEMNGQTLIAESFQA